MRTSRTRRIGALGAVLVWIGTGCGDDGGGRGENGRVEEPSNISVYELQPGDCAVPPDEVGTGAGTLRVVPCDEPHTQEVFAIVEYRAADSDDVPGPNADFPGDEVLNEYAKTACLEPFQEYFDVDYVDSSLFLTYLLPSVRSWSERTDRDVVCIAQTDGEPVTQSLAGSGR